MSKYAVFLLLIFILGVIVIGPFVAKSSDAGVMALPSAQDHAKGDTAYVVFSSGVLLSQNGTGKDGKGGLSVASTEENIPAQEKMTVLVTAYSSTPEETDSTPFITASGTYVSFGTVAANFLPIGTKVRLPNLFGNQVFVVEDRLSERYNDRIDVWLPTKAEAIRFGEKITDAEIL